MQRRTRPSFEYTGDERAQLEPQGTSAASRYLATEINMGRRLVAKFQDIGGEPSHDLVPPPLGDRPEIYYDAISFILPAAAYEGIDPEALCSEARETQRCTYRDALTRPRLASPHRHIDTDWEDHSQAADAHGLESTLSHLRVVEPVGRQQECCVRLFGQCEGARQPARPSTGRVGPSSFMAPPAVGPVAADLCGVQPPPDWWIENRNLSRLGTLHGRQIQ